MRTSLIGVAAGLALATGYIASPLLSAWAIREAIRSGNTAYLETKLEWPTVRASLRESLTEYALGPTAVASPALNVKPGLWKRIKEGMSRRAVDNLVESYVTPEGLPQVFGMRQLYREKISGEAAALEALPWHKRARDFWRRIKRAEFHSPTEFEIEMADRNEPSRHYVGVLKLRGFEWKLIELRLRLMNETTTSRT